MKNYNESVKINSNPNWPYTLNHLYMILMIDSSESGKTSVLLNLLKHQRPDHDIVCTSKTNLNQNISYLSIEEKKY